jgi:tripartite-type tricarboxylate transporter receptor subunit TctC
VAADFPGFEAWAWQGIVAPARTPPAIITKLNDAYRRAVGQQGIRDKLTGAGIEVLQSTPEEMAAYMRTEGDKWDKVIKSANIKLE